MRAKDGLLTELEDDVLSGRPLADALRKCIMLGGRAGSTELRQWATRELKGYEPGDSVPEFRTVAAPILVDALNGNTIITGQRISPRELPDFVHDQIDEAFTFRNGIGEIEAMIEQAMGAERGLKLSLPMAADLGHVMDQASGNPFQHINALYWSISPVALRGIVDRVKTTLAELVAEMRAGMAPDETVPSAQLTDQAVNIAVNGNRSRVSVNTAQSTNGGISTTSSLDDTGGSAFWTRSKRIAAFVAGTASIVGLGVGLAQVNGWL